MTNITTPINHINENNKINAENIIETFHKYKRYYDLKAQAEPLKVRDFTFVLKIDYTKQLEETKIRFCIGLGHTGSPKSYGIPTTSFGKSVLTRHSAFTKCVLESQGEIVDVQTDDKQHFPDPQAAKDHKFFNAHVQQTLYGPIHLPEETHHISEPENAEANQLMTDTDDLDSVVTMPEVRQNDRSRQFPSRVIPNIRPTQPIQQKSRHH